MVQEGDLIFKFHPDEAKVLREYAIPLAKEAIEAVGELYQFTPKGPILIEIFPVHDDFAVRNLGLPGLVGALGACFGRVVSMDSPRAKAAGIVLVGGDALARARARHHAADVEPAGAALADRGRVGLRREPGSARTWGGEMEVPFALAMERGRVLPLKDLNSGLHEAGHDRAGVLPGVAARRPHRRHARRSGAASVVRSMPTASRVTPRSARAWACLDRSCRARSTGCWSRGSRGADGAARSGKPARGPRVRRGRAEE